MADSPADQYLAWIEIDIQALRHNYAEVRRITGAREVLAMVKCNACGHGAVGVARALAEVGVKFFGVASVAEALELREGGIGQDILNAGPFAPADAPAILEQNIVQAVFSMPGAEALERAGATADKTARVHLKVDTGLGRLGAPFEEAFEFAGNLKELKHLRFEGVFSSLTEAPEFDYVQLERFKRVLGQLEGAGISPGRVHLVASAGVIDFPEAHFEMVRPGTMLLGLYPNRHSRGERKVKLVPALSLKARVARVARLPKGESVSYHRKYIAGCDTCIATLSVGYSHGYPASAVGKAEVLIRGRRCPVIGGIPTTAMFVQLGRERAAAEGDEAVLIGRQGDETVTAEELAAAAGISSYRLVTSLSPKLPRLFVTR